jgi:subtilisin family serine protease
MLGTWGWHCGTSFTGPQIAGIAALALSLKPELSSAAIADALRTTAVPVNGVGAGRVDAFAALQKLGAIPTKPPPPPAAKMTTVVRTGAVRRLARVRLAVGDGSLRLNLTVKPKDRCELTVNAGSEIVLGNRRASGVVALSTRVTAGRYGVEIRCRTLKAKRYRLSVSAVLAPRTASGR